MCVSRESYSSVLRVMDRTTAPNKVCVRAEWALGVTAVVLLILATCAFARVGALASCSHSVGFSCVGIAALIVISKMALLSLQCCKPWIASRSNTHYFNTSDRPQRTLEWERANAIAYEVKLRPLDDPEDPDLP